MGLMDAAATLISTSPGRLQKATAGVVHAHAGARMAASVNGGRLLPDAPDGLGEVCLKLQHRGRTRGTHHSCLHDPLVAVRLWPQPATHGVGSVYAVCVVCCVWAWCLGGNGGSLWAWLLF